MADDSEDEDAELKKGTRDALIAVGGAGVGLLLGGPLGALAAPALIGATKLLWNEADAWRARRALLVTNQLAAELDLPEGDEEQQQAIAELLEDPVNAETIVQAFQKMLDATASAAWPCIAAVTADYVRQGEVVDGFFHDAVAVLASLDDEGLGAAETLFEKAEPYQDRIDRGKRVTVNYNEPPHQNLTFTSPPELEKKEYFSAAPSGIQRALRILGANGFGQVRGDQIILGGASTEEPCWRLLGYIRRRVHAPADREREDRPDVNAKIGAT